MTTLPMAAAVDDLRGPIELAPGVWFGETTPGDDRVSLRELPVVILVGASGSGKSTIIDTMGDRWRELPNRRTVTSRIIIEPRLEAEGRAGRYLPRLERYAYVRAFRDRHPGGMGGILSRLWIEPRLRHHHCVFDGLRGESEVRCAARALPAARFVVLVCPDAVRLSRLLGRGDPHDRPLRDPEATGAVPGLAEPAVRAALGDKACERLEEALRVGQLTSEELEAKLSILRSEWSTHDLPGAIRLLTTSYPARTLVLDSERLSPIALRDEILRRDWGPRAETAVPGVGEAEGE